jgi:hypothetical protein
MGDLRAAKRKSEIFATWRLCAFALKKLQEATSENRRNTLTQMSQNRVGGTARGCCKGQKAQRKNRAKLDVCAFQEKSFS